VRTIGDYELRLLWGKHAIQSIRISIHNENGEQCNRPKDYLGIRAFQDQKRSLEGLARYFYQRGKTSSPDIAEYMRTRGFPLLIKLELKEIEEATDNGR
jgi:uncharacterized protein YccT (UPF0319 family)